MQTRKLLLAHPDLQLKNLLEKTILIPAGFEVISVTDLASARALMIDSTPDLVLLGDKLQDGNALELAAEVLMSHPNIPIILIASSADQDLFVEAVRSGVSDYLFLPLHTRDVQAALARAESRQKSLEQWSQGITQPSDRPNTQQADSLESAQQGNKINQASRQVESLLSALVKTAVEMSGAEEGCLLLRDESTGELTMHTAYNFPEEYARSFRLPIGDSMAWHVMGTGQSINFYEDKPQIILPNYLVQALICAPLEVDQRVIGVLSIDKRQADYPFTEKDLKLTNILAQFASVLIENTEQCSQSENERHKLETILTQVEDGVMVIGTDGRIILVNNAARSIFGVTMNYIKERPAREVFRNPDLLDIFEDQRVNTSRTEIKLEDGRAFNAQITPIPDIGVAIILQDITHLKELDRIKTDFVNTVSHDLRSPLTTILGYAELIDRAGPVTEQQKDFIRRIQSSVNHITNLINDLLDLGRIEAGFDARKEIVDLPVILKHVIDSLQKRSAEKKQTVRLELPENLPHTLGNPYRLRQLFTNLVNNAVQFTQPGGAITIRAQAESGQVIIQLIDNGSGIPTQDQPYIFEKFYRGSNIPSDLPGTGLGLAIVKSIVDNHQGRVWVDSTLGEGTTITVVLTTV